MVALREIMTGSVQTTGPDTPMSDAAAVMVRGRFGSVLVTTGTTLVGIVTERDVLRAAAQARDLADEQVRNWMTADPITAAPDEDSEDAAQTMLTRGFRHLPVVEGGGVVGVVSLRDLFSARVRRRG
jgi:CBS domain-containing protein